MFISGYFSNAFKLGTFELKNKNYKDIFFGYLIDCDIMPKVNLGPDHNFCDNDTLKPQGTFKSYLWSNLLTTEKIAITESGNYMVQATDKYGCESKDTLIALKLTVPALELGPNVNICDGTSLVLNAGASNLPWLWSDGSTGSQLTVSHAGTYTVQLNGTDCKVSDFIIVTTKPSPVVNLGPDIVAESTQTVYLDAGAGYVSYLWSNNATSRILTVPMHLITATTKGWVKVTATNGCIGSDTIILSQPGMAPLKSTGNENTLTKLEQQDNNETLAYKIYPNPNHGLFYIEIANPDQLKQIDIFDARGNLVKTYKNVISQPLEVDLSGQAKGAYMVIISEDKLVRQFKIVLD